LAVSARLPASDFSLIIKNGLDPFYRWFDPDRYYLWLWHIWVYIGRAVSKASRWLERRAITAMLLVCLGLIIAILGVPVSKLPAGEVSGAHLSTLPVAIGLAAICLICAASAIPGGKLPLLLMAISGILAIGGVSSPSAITRLWLLESAAVFSLLLVWKTAHRGRAAQVYFLAVVVAGLATVSATLLFGSAPPSLLLALFLVGITIKLALIPVYFWLPLVAESVPAPVAGLVVAVVDVAAFGELYILRGTAPWLFNPVAVWLGIAVITALGGAVLMLGQRDLKRLLVFSSLEDMGYLLFAVSAGSELALQGALYGAAVHSLGKALLFSSLAKVETDGRLKPGARSLASSYPISGVGFLLGLLALSGIPPTLGYIARWRIYTTAAEVSPWLFGILLVASALALLAYARALAVNWWSGGKAGQGFCSNQVPTSPEPWLLRVALLGVSILLLVTGIWPALIGW
jgi:multicomponent Na+:H+ antiporter subunit D